MPVEVKDEAAVTRREGREDVYDEQQEVGPSTGGGAFAQPIEVEVRFNEEEIVYAQKEAEGGLKEPTDYVVHRIIDH